MIIESRAPRDRGQFWKPSAGDDLHVVKHEPMFFQADVNFAATHGGPITHAFLKEALFYLTHIGVRPQDVNLFLDSRVHMLMPGWWPCIPGWHHDDVERSTPDGQPNYRTAAYRPEFLMGIVGSADCGTEFATGKYLMPDPEVCDVVYKRWHPHVDLQSVIHGNDVVQVEPNRLYRFTDRDFHQGVPCKNTGWRWFGRITIGNPTVKPANEIRRNANVYMENPMEGW
jgi:hypothetical protein